MSERRTATSTRERLAPLAHDRGAAAVTLVALDFFFDAGSFAAEVSQVVELRTANITTSFHLDLCNGGTVRLKHALDAFAVRNLPDCKR